MKLFLSALFFLAADPAFAHPGHGAPGLLHLHGEWLLVALAVGLAWWVWRR